jgi:hypothetical protein
VKLLVSESASEKVVAPIQCSQVDLDNVLQNFSGERVAFPVNYLGLPITLGRLRIRHIQNKFDRATANLSGWQGRLINSGGRRELVRTVLGSLPTYLLTVIKPPK